MYFIANLVLRKREADYLESLYHCRQKMPAAHQKTSEIDRTYLSLQLLSHYPCLDSSSHISLIHP